ncbi:hypothetical protein DFH11DRAFT_1742813 [Phellopilus nigrolimitatus]|nr:hypothetical protein DFH11DRAFT_1742813 [Phellopilus nigrolimitatus]
MSRINSPAHSEVGLLDVFADKDGFHTDQKLIGDSAETGKTGYSVEKEGRLSWKEVMRIVEIMIPEELLLKELWESCILEIYRRPTNNAILGKSFSLEDKYYRVLSKLPGEIRIGYEIPDNKKYPEQTWDASTSDMQSFFIMLAERNPEGVNHAFDRYCKKKSIQVVVKETIVEVLKQGMSEPEIFALDRRLSVDESISSDSAKQKHRAMKRNNPSYMYGPARKTQIP